MRELQRSPDAEDAQTLPNAVKCAVDWDAMGHPLSLHAERALQFITVLELLSR